MSVAEDMTTRQAGNELGGKDEDRGLRVVQRVVFPVTRDLDTLPLYVDPDIRKVQSTTGQSREGTVQTVSAMRATTPPGSR